ncbi:hypothetical protein SLL00_06545 [Metabacillus indicus]|uniref:DUF6843 domain-containing protein n=1 Tax=Metabacillus indicus TaxID=246786 RepID=UPI002A04F698|nr:hypothetical protein [Metabacillus indicus]MDX8289443.1 hypothetical protein [Metabacillus indicus]
MKLLFAFLLIGTLSGCSIFEKEKTTDNIYLIPEGFEGSITVFYDVPSEPKLKKEGKYTVIPVTELALEALKDTDIYIYGASFTSTPNVSYGVVTDKYYYVDENGKRTPIDKQCVHQSGNGFFSGASEMEIIYSELQITKTHCNQSFWTDGIERYHSQQSEVLGFWMNTYD